MTPKAASSQHSCRADQGQGRLGPVVHTVIATALLCAATVAYTRHMPEFGRFFVGHNDFLPVYTQSRLVATGTMYDVDAVYQEQDRTLGFHVIGRYHSRPPWLAWLRAPLAWLPYTPSYWLWIAANLACFAFLVRFWLLPRDYLLWGVVFFPVAASIIVAQDSLMVAACMAGVLLLANRGRDVAAGLLLALCTAKPHLFLLLPAALIFHRRWRLLVSASLGTAGLLAISTGVAGFDWPWKLSAVWRLMAQYSGGDVPLRPSLFQLGVNGVTITVAALLGVLLCTLIRRTRTVEAGIAAAILGSIVLAPHSSVYDLPILLIALPALPLSGWGRWLRVALLTPVPYWALLRGLPWSASMPLMLLATVAASAYTSRATTTQPKVRESVNSEGRGPFSAPLPGAHAPRSAITPAGKPQASDSEGLS